MQDQEHHQPRLKLIAHVREKIASGHYANPAILQATVTNMLERGATALPTLTLARLEEEQARSRGQGDRRTVEDIDRIMRRRG